MQKTFQRAANLKNQKGQVRVFRTHHSDSGWIYGTVHINEKGRRPPIFFFLMTLLHSAIFFIGKVTLSIYANSTEPCAKIELEHCLPLNIQSFMCENLNHILQEKSYIF